MNASATTLIRLEMTKLFAKKESYLLFTMWLIPVLYGAGFRSGSDSFIYRGTEPISCLIWLQIMFTMVYQFFVFYAFTIIVATRTLGSEIEDRSMLLYIPRTNSRARIFGVRIAAVSIFVLIALAGYLLVSIASYYLLMADLPAMASGTFGAGARSPGIWMFVGAVSVSFLVLTVLTAALSNYVKPLLCIAGGVVLQVALGLLGQMAPFAYVIPSFYMVRLLDVVLGATPTSARGNLAISFPATEPGLLFACFAGISLAWILAAYAVGVRAFLKRDL